MSSSDGMLRMHIYMIFIEGDSSRVVQKLSTIDFTQTKKHLVRKCNKFRWCKKWAGRTQTNVYQPSSPECSSIVVPRWWHRVEFHTTNVSLFWWIMGRFSEICQISFLSCSGFACPYIWRIAHIDMSNFSNFELSSIVLPIRGSRKSGCVDTSSFFSCWATNFHHRTRRFHDKLMPFEQLVEGFKNAATI